MRIRTQLLVVGAVAVLVAITVMASLAYVSKRNAEALRSQDDNREVARGTASLLALTLEHSVYGSGRTANQWRDRQETLEQTLEASLARSAEPHPALVELREKLGIVGGLFDRFDEGFRADQTDLAQRRRELTVERLVSASQELIEARYRWSAVLDAELARTKQVTTTIVLLGLGLLLLVGLALVLVVWRKVLMPLGGLEASAAAIQAGRLDERVDHAGARDELGDTARAVDAMARTLLANNSALQREVQHRAQAEQRLRSSEALLERAGQIAGVGGWEVDLRNQSVHWSAQTRRIHEVDADYVPVLAEAINFYAPEARSAMQTAVEEGISNGKGWDLELPFITAKGRSIWVRAVGTAEYEDGQPVRLVGAFQDVTARKLAEATLAQEQQLMNSLLATAPDQIYFKDPNSRFLRINPALARRFGLADPAQAVGKSDADFFESEHAVRTAATERRIFETGEPVVDLEELELWPDRPPTWNLTTKMPLRNPDGQIIGTFGVSRDITSRKEMELVLASKSTELARSNADLEQFAYIAAHDLQEPLRMVASYTELLGKRYKGQLDEKADKYIFYAVDGAKRMQQLILGLMAYSRVGSQGKPLVLVSAHASLQRAQRSLQSVINEAGATIDAGLLPSVLGDEVQLDQLFQNLLGNAIRFRSEAPLRISIIAEREESFWKFSVKDNGIGMDPKYAERVFQMFQRLHERGTYEGSGIGLSIAKRIVERHGGRIWLESAPGAGATFYFTLTSGLSH